MEKKNVEKVIKLKVIVLMTFLLGVIPMVYAEETYHHFLTLESPEPENPAWYGYRVAISEEVIAISEPYAKIDEYPGAGKVYLYDLEGKLIASLRSPAPRNNDNFGYRIDLSDTQVLIGAITDIGALEHAGKAHIFTSKGELLKSYQSPNPKHAGYFGGGGGVALTDNLIVISEINAKTDPGSAGLVHIFNPDGSHIRNLTSPKPIVAGKFGSCIEVSDALILIGETGTSSIPRSPGSVYIFNHSGNHKMTLMVPNPEEMRDLAYLYQYLEIISS